MLHLLSVCRDIFGVVGSLFHLHEVADDAASAIFTLLWILFFLSQAFCLYHVLRNSVSIFCAGKARHCSVSMLLLFCAIVNMLLSCEQHLSWAKAEYARDVSTLATPEVRGLLVDHGGRFDYAMAYTRWTFTYSQWFFVSQRLHLLMVILLMAHVESHRHNFFNRPLSLLYVACGPFGTGCVIPLLLCSFLMPPDKKRAMGRQVPCNKLLVLGFVMVGLCTLLLVYLLDEYRYTALMMLHASLLILATRQQFFPQAVDSFPQPPRPPTWTTSWIVWSNNALFFCGVTMHSYNWCLVLQQAVDSGGLINLFSELWNTAWGSEHEMIVVADLAMSTVAVVLVILFSGKIQGWKERLAMALITPFVGVAYILPLYNALQEESEDKEEYQLWWFALTESHLTASSSVAPVFPAFVSAPVPSNSLRAITLDSALLSPHAEQSLMAIAAHLRFTSTLDRALLPPNAFLLLPSMFDSVFRCWVTTARQQALVEKGVRMLMSRTVGKGIFAKLQNFVTGVWARCWVRIRGGNILIYANDPEKPNRIIPLSHMTDIKLLSQEEMIQSLGLARPSAGDAARETVSDSNTYFGGSLCYYGLQLSTMEGKGTILAAESKGTRDAFFEFLLSAKTWSEGDA